MSCSDPCEGACPPLPDAFVRLRYFFGKRLGVADLRDEQAYHRGKGRFHNRHLHGSGVVCGLALSPYEVEGGEPTLLRVSAGAALDTCGREIVVGRDQCIDLAAWLRRKQEEAKRTGATFPPTGAIGEDGRLAVTIAVRHREHATSPEPAPKDPCSCEGGGCEYGRTVETFELGVLVEEEVPRVVHPGADVLRAALDGAADQGSLDAALAAAITSGCPSANDPDWVILGALTVGVSSPEDDTEAPPAVVALSDAETWTGPPAWLLSTSAIQTLLVAALAPPAGEPPAPILGLRLVPGAGTDTLTVDTGLDVEAATAVPAAVKLRAFDGTAWSGVTPTGVSAASGPTPGVDVKLGAALAVGRYALVLTLEDGVVDTAFRPVAGRFFFRIEDDGSGGRRLVVTAFTGAGTEVG